MLIQMICSFIGTMAFSVLFHVPKKFYVYCGFTGMASWMTYVLLRDVMSVSAAVFFATIIVVLCSRVLAVWRKCPITVFLIAGIFPLVPGASVYYTAYNIGMNNLRLAVNTGLDALKVAFAIVLGIVFVVSIPKRWFVPEYWLTRRIKKNIMTDSGSERKGE